MVSFGGSKVKLLAIILGIVSTVALALLISTIVLGVRLNKKTDDLDRLEGSVCTTQECVTAAGNLIQSMDMSVNPCEDFYRFSCGNWIKKNPIPASYSSWNQFNILRDQLGRDVQLILENEINGERDPMPVLMAKNFYNVCVTHMQENTTDQIVLFQLIETELSLASTNLNNLDSKLAEIRREVGGALLANMYVGLDEVNASRHMIYVDQPTLGINRAFLVNPSHNTYRAYQELIAEAWPLVYTNTNSDEAAVIAQQIIDFESKIANISTPPEQRRNRTELYNLRTVAEFNNHTSESGMNWVTYIQEVFRGTDIPLESLPTLQIVVRDLSYFAEFGKILTETEVQVLVNYLRWRIIFGLGNEVSTKLREVFFDFTRKTQGTQFPNSLWKVCADKANGFFGMAISYDYVQEIFSGDFHQQMQEMIRYIQSAMSATIDTVDWVRSTDTREKAKEKAGKMKDFIGYPEWLLNITALEDYYNGLSLSSPNLHFQNYRDIAKWRNIEGLKWFVKSKDPERWITDPTVVNAFYSSAYNSISFPAGILQSPFYFTGKPIQALNYGAIGVVIGHEITHGFDDRGRQNDGDGNLADWWDEETVNNYVDKARCFVEQYSRYTAEEANNITVNGNNTLGENIADNGGIRQAFMAYKAYVSEHGQEPSLPGLDYTPEQLFFLAFGQIWCGSYTVQGIENQILTGVHSPNRFRVRGSLDNSPEFAEAWNCTIPNEQNICKIW